jgi:RNA polymerase sigma-70 factor (ECF subfamily)
MRHQLTSRPLSFDKPAQNSVSSDVATPDAVKELAKRLEDLFQSMRDELVSSLCLILGSRDDAMDVAQEAFLRCWKLREQLLGVTNPRAWIFRVGINAAKDLRRSAWRRKSRPMLPEEAMPPINRAGIPETLEATEERARVRLAVETLRFEEKEIFLMRQNGELTLEEIAQAVGRPVGTVKTQLRAALGKLRIALGVPNGETKGGNDES